MDLLSNLCCIFKNLLAFLFTCFWDFVEKTLETYIRFFSQLKRLTGTKEPYFCILDLEKGTMLASKGVFINSRLFNCSFHFSQCFWREIQRENLISRYKDDKDFLFYMKMLISICFVSEDQVENIFFLLLNQNI
ncbi:hypothetical protein DMUE_4438 [Dictyocoela muelleri]|nr:hypothetical protein DMUE_4438 [Dictyocoela muelleri]